MKDPNKKAINNPKKNRRGRPALPPELRRVRFVAIVAPETLARIELLAKERGVPAAGYVLDADYRTH